MEVNLIAMSQPAPVLHEQFAEGGLNTQDILGYAAATCTNTASTLDRCRRALDIAMRSRHESVLEHVSMTFEVKGVSRVLLAQLTRHRFTYFSVQSQRYAGVNFAAQVVPTDIRANGALMEEYMKLADASEAFYNHCLEAGVKAEDARYGTLQSCTTDVVMTMNVREILHFLRIRECNKAQAEIRELACKVRDICMAVMPNVFGDRCGAPCRYGACPELRPCGTPKTKRVETDNYGTSDVCVEENASVIG